MEARAKPQPLFRPALPSCTCSLSDIQSRQARFRRPVKAKLAADPSVCGGGSTSSFLLGGIAGSRRIPLPHAAGSQNGNGQRVQVLAEALLMNCFSQPAGLLRILQHEWWGFHSGHSPLTVCLICPYHLPHNRALWRVLYWKFTGWLHRGGWEKQKHSY